MIPYTHAAYDLLHQGAQAMAEIEANGMRVDVEYVKHAIRRTTHQIAHRTEELKSLREWKEWQTAFGNNANLFSVPQLSHVLFERLGYKSGATTQTGKLKVDDEVLEDIDSDFVRGLVQMKRLQKAVSTNLQGLLREVVDGYVHPFFSLHTTATYRSSSDSPNFQNQPVRFPELAKLIRSAFVARPGRRLVEIDYSGLEVRIAACYHKDPNMLAYINDPSKDMHRDMARECYFLQDGQVTKQTRFSAKSFFVFAEFYGDWYIDTARGLWNAIHKLKLQTVDGVPLKQHLREHGIRELGALDPRNEPHEGSFEKHIRNVERNFWGKRFPTYAQWRKDWFAQYQKRGWLKTLTGFVCQGFMKRNEVINYAVQGSAFHCLLWSVIRLVMIELRRRGMKSLIVGQIHDSIVADVPDEEMGDFLAISNRVMTVLIRRVWPWIIVPLAVEVEASPVNGSWFQKEKIEVAA